MLPACSAAPGRHGRHGLTAQRILTPYEHPDDWRRFHKAVVDSLQPEPGIEAHLADGVAEPLWRLRHVPFAEAEFTQHQYRLGERAHARHGPHSGRFRRIRRNSARREGYASI